MIRYLSLVLLVMLSSCSSNSKREIEQIEKPPIKDSILSRDLFPSFESYNQWDSLLELAAQKHDLDWVFIKAIMIKESHANENYISSVGAVGLMQLMPRKGSFVNQDYRNYQACRDRNRSTDG